MPFGWRTNIDLQVQTNKSKLNYLAVNMDVCHGPRTPSSATDNCWAFRRGEEIGTGFSSLGSHSAHALNTNLEGWVREKHPLQHVPKIAPCLYATGEKTHPYKGTSKLPLSGLFALFLSGAPLSCSDIVFNIGLVAVSSWSKKKSVTFKTV